MENQTLSQHDGVLRRARLVLEQGRRTEGWLQDGKIAVV